MPYPVLPPPGCDDALRVRYDSHGVFSLGHSPPPGAVQPLDECPPLQQMHRVVLEMNLRCTSGGDESQMPQLSVVGDASGNGRPAAIHLVSVVVELLSPALVKLAV